MSCRKTSFNIAASSNSNSEYSEYCNYQFNSVVWLLRTESILFFSRAAVSISPGKRESDVSKSLTREQIVKNTFKEVAQNKGRRACVFRAPTWSHGCMI